MRYKAIVRRLKAWVGCRYVCLYDVEDRILLRRVQISSNRSLDGVLDQLNSKEMTDAGPAALLDDAASDEDELLPPTTAGAAYSSPCDRDVTSSSACTLQTPRPLIVLFIFLSSRIAVKADLYRSAILISYS